MDSPAQVSPSLYIDESNHDLPDPTPRGLERLPLASCQNRDDGRGLGLVSVESCQEQIGRIP
jgi:hypothetical protein